MQQARLEASQPQESASAQLRLAEGVVSGSIEESMPLEKLLVQGIRAGMYVLVLTLAILHHLYQNEFFSWEVYRNFYAISALGLILPVISLPFLNRFFEHRSWVALSFLVDVVLITALLMTSRLNQSIFLFLYLMTIILGGLVFRLRGALLLALTCSLASTLVLLFGEEMKSMGFFFLLLLNNIAFFSVAWISGFLAEQLQAQGLSISDLRRLNQSIVETIPSGLLTVLGNGQVIQANPGAKEILGDELSSALQEHRPVQDIFPHEALQGWPSIIRREIRIPRGDETQILNLKVLPQIVGEERTYLVVIEDETQVKKLEFAVRQSEKLAAVGQLAAGIAHEIRNPLAGISGSIQLLSQQHQSEDDQKLTRIILKEIDRLNNLISEFLDFAKPETPPVESVDLGVLMEEVLGQLRFNPQFRSEIIFNFQKNGDLRIRGHRDKLKQAILNMLINACQAMAQTEQPRLDVMVAERGQAVRLDIADNGCGMSESTMKRMFEPFLTTKPKGTGLGLAITHKILETHQAQIFVESKINQGTRISMEFPRLDQPEKV